MFALQPALLRQAPVNPLRMVTHANLIGEGNDVSSGTLLGRGMKVAHYVGSGDVTELRMMLCSWSLGASNLEGAILPGNDFTITQMWVTVDGAGSGVQVTWGGATSKVISSGQTEITSDPITPAALGFGGGSIPHGTLLYVGYGATVAAAGMSFPAGDGGHGGTLGGFQGFAYNPLNTGLTNLQGSGQMFADGAQEIGSTNNNLSPPVMVIGKFTSPMVGVFCGIGDSITYGLNDGGNGYAEGRGWFTRSLFDSATTFTNPRAGLKLAKNGGVASVWNGASINGAQAKLAGLAKYANRFIERYGINSINAQGDQGAADGLHAEKKIIWDACRAASPLSELVACAPLTPKTSSSDGWATVGNQTPISGQGGQIDLLDTDLAAAVGVSGQIDAYIQNTNAVGVRGNVSKASADYWRWAVGATVDGVHPEAATHELMAGAVRTWMQANL